MVLVNFSIYLILIFLITHVFFGEVYCGVVNASFIINGESNHGGCNSDWEKIEKEIPTYFAYDLKKSESDKITYNVIETTGPGSATDQAYEYYTEWKASGDEGDLLLIAVGGDGTVSEVVQKFSEAKRVKFGVLPMGTGNDLARTLKMPINDPGEALRILREGKSQSQGAYFIKATCVEDPAQEDERVCIANFDLGITARAGEAKKSHDLGVSSNILLRTMPKSWVYRIATSISILTCDFPKIEMKVDENEPIKLPLSLLVSSTGPTMGAGVEFFPGMSPQQEKGLVGYLDGVDNVCRLSVEMLRVACWSSDYFNRESFEKLTITHVDGSPPQHIHIDGEIGKWQTPISVTWKPNVFQFVGAEKVMDSNTQYTSLEGSSI